MQIALQTQLAALGYLMLILTQLLVYKKDFMRKFWMVLITVPLALYVLNCTVVGKCVEYAWIYSVLLYSFGFLGLLSLLMLVFKA